MFSLKGKMEIGKEARVVAALDEGPPVEISFKGKHWDGCGNDLHDFVDRTVKNLSPVGVVMNLSDFNYRVGNCIGAMLFPLIDRQTHKFLPFCIVARGRTAKSLKSLFAFTQVPNLENAKYFDDAIVGLKFVKKKIRKYTRNDRFRDRPHRCTGELDSVVRSATSSAADQESRSTEVPMFLSTAQNPQGRANHNDRYPPPSTVTVPETSPLALSS